MIWSFSNGANFPFHTLGCCINNIFFTPPCRSLLLLLLHGKLKCESYELRPSNCKRSCQKILKTDAGGAECIRKTVISPKCFYCYVGMNTTLGQYSSYFCSLQLQLTLYRLTEERHDGHKEEDGDEGGWHAVFITT